MIREPHPPAPSPHGEGEHVPTLSPVPDGEIGSVFKSPLHMETGFRGEIFLLVGLLIAALFARLPLTDAALFDFAPMRQFYSALTARSIYFDLAPEPISEWRQVIVDDYMRTATRLEPPVIETIAALAYRLIGREDLRIPIALSWLYWGAGAVMLYLIARKLSGRVFPPLIAFVVYLFLPYTITATRTFMPDPPALMFMLASIYALLHYDDAPTSKRLLSAAFLALPALFIRLMTGFFLYPVFGLLMWRKYGFKRAITHPHTWIFILISATPTLIYYISTVLATLAGRGRLDSNFVPSLFGQASFWSSLWTLITTAFPAPIFVLAALSAAVTAIFVRGRSGAVIGGLWIGYALYGGYFNFHISTHPYYQTIFVPAVALSLAMDAVWILRFVDGHFTGGRPNGSPLQDSAAFVGATSRGRPFQRAGTLPRPYMVIVVFALAFILATTLPFSAVFPSEPDMIPVYRAAGEAAEHSPHIVAITDNWATPLRYYGEVAGMYFPTRFEIDMYKPMGDAGIPELTPADRIAGFTAQMGGADFFIITDMRELDNQPDLRTYLEQTYPVVAYTERYAVYDLRHDLREENND